MTATAYAKSHRRLAGRQYRPYIRSDCLVLRLHPLEVKGIANGDIAAGIKGMDPISNGQLTRDEIERCQK